MLQSLRENLKGTVAVFVLAIFIIPLVLFGVEQLFVGSIGGADVAKVNGEGIHRREFQRELELERQRLQQRFDLPPNDPQLQDDAIGTRVIQNLVNREALYQAATNGGMGASQDEMWRQIAQIEAFQENGRFSYELFRERISFLYTPANFLHAFSKDFVLNHVNAGVSGSNFVTDLELELLARITQQTRSFFTIKIPAPNLEEMVISEEEIQSAYEMNQRAYMEPERASVQYIELRLEEIASNMTVDEADVRALYEEEIREFKADPQYEVAHILIEEKEGSEATLALISEKLAAGEDFAELARTYSDDLGSRAAGGQLGTMIEDVYPPAFVRAVKTLSVGEVSAPVVTDAGTHLVQLVSKTNVEPPSFDERRDALRRMLARELAQDEYLRLITRLEELTFGTDSLQPAANALGLSVKSSEPFTRRGGPGIAAEAQVVNATFADDVLTQRQNSRVLEISGDRSVVLRLQDYHPETLNPLEKVRDRVVQQLRTQKAAQKLAEQTRELMAAVRGGQAPEAVAEASGLEFNLHENVSRTDFEVDSRILQEAFALAKPEADQPVLAQANLSSGGAALIGLTGVEAGSLTSMEPAQVAAMRQQLGFQLAQTELQSFENSVIERAKISISR